MKQRRRVNGTDVTQPVPPRSGLVQLLSVLPTPSAVYSVAQNYEKSKIAARFFNQPIQ
jgi:hypothetical protein